MKNIPFKVVMACQDMLLTFIVEQPKVTDCFNLYFWLIDYSDKSGFTDPETHRHHKNFNL